MNEKDHVAYSVIKDGEEMGRFADLWSARHLVESDSDRMPDDAECTYEIFEIEYVRRYEYKPQPLSGNPHSQLTRIT